MNLDITATSVKSIIAGYCKEARRFGVIIKFNSKKSLRLYKILRDTFGENVADCAYAGFLILFKSKEKAALAFDLITDFRNKNVGDVQMFDKNGNWQDSYGEMKGDI
jgi:hypothetical protein